MRVSLLARVLDVAPAAVRPSSATAAGADTVAVARARPSSSTVVERAGRVVVRCGQSGVMRVVRWRTRLSPGVVRPAGGRTDGERQPKSVCPAHLGPVRERAVARSFACWIASTSSRLVIVDGHARRGAGQSIGPAASCLRRSANAASGKVRCLMRPGQATALDCSQQAGRIHGQVDQVDVAAAALAGDRPELGQADQPRLAVLVAAPGGGLGDERAAAGDRDRTPPGRGAEGPGAADDVDAAAR